MVGPEASDHAGVSEVARHEGSQTPGINSLPPAENPTLLAPSLASSVSGTTEELPIRTPKSSLRTGITYPPSPDASQRIKGMNDLQFVAQTCFPLEGGYESKPMVRQGSAYIPAVDYLENHHVENDDLSSMFSDRRRVWRLEGPQFDPFDGVSHKEVLMYMQQTLAPINETSVDRSLDGTSEAGFNKHGAEHANRVTAQTLRLLDYTAAGEESKIIGVLAAQGHDIGNLFDRAAHPQISARMMRRIMPDLVNNRPAWNKINRAIVLHDSDNLQAVMALWGNIPEAERVKRLAGYMGPEGLALLIADKVDIGNDRISDKPLAPSAVHDKHLLVNLLGTHNGIEPSGSSFIWRVKYSKEFTPRQRSKLKHLISGVEKRIDSGQIKADFDDWDQMFVRLYSDRMITTVQAALGYFPSLENVEIVMVDQDTNTERKKRIFKRGSLDKDMARLKEEKASYTKNRR